MNSVIFKDTKPVNQQFPLYPLNRGSCLGKHPQKILAQSTLSNTKVRKN